MTMPDQTEHQDVSPVAQVAADAWLQEGPVGGQDIHGRPAATATAVTVAGLVLVRDVPALAATAQAYSLAASTPMRLGGAVPQRRHMTVVCSVAGYIGPDPNALTAAQPSGLLCPANVPIVVNSAAEVWVSLTAPGVASCWSDLDLG